MTNTFIVHHNPSNGRYEYSADPTDAIASANALVAEGAGRWVAGNCRKMIRPGDFLLLKFGGARLQQQPGLYAAAHVTKAPWQDADGAWVFAYKPDADLTQHLIRFPVVGEDLARVVDRSFGASIQSVKEPGLRVLEALLADRVVKRSFGASIQSVKESEPQVLEVLPATRAKAKASHVGEKVTHGLVIRKDPIDQILAGTKTWEIRGNATTRRGPIALIQSKSGQVVGVCEVVDVRGPLSLTELQQNARRAGFRADELEYENTYAWVLRNARRLRKPIPYRHPSGAVIWIKLESEVVRSLKRAALDS